MLNPLRLDTLFIITAIWLPRSCVTSSTNEHDSLHKKQEYILLTQAVLAELNPSYAPEGVSTIIRSILPAGAREGNDEEGNCIIGFLVIWLAVWLMLLDIAARELRKSSYEDAGEVIENDGECFPYPWNCPVPLHTPDNICHDSEMVVE